VLEIACGTGYWTTVIAETAQSVLATDVCPNFVLTVQQRLSGRSNVRCQIANAYALDDIEGKFNSAFAHWWWSHIPKSEIARFLNTLHSKLLPNAFIMFIDQLAYPNEGRHIDDEGNMLEQRKTPDGRTFDIIKNFPTKQEIRSVLKDVADNIEYIENESLGYWGLSYRVKMLSRHSAVC